MPRLQCREVARDPLRSGIRRLSQRSDIACIMLVVVLAAFLNAAAMIGPGAEFFARMGSVVPASLQAVVSLAGTISITGIFIGAAWLAAKWMGVADPSGANRQIFSRFSLALLPLGLGMWSAHLLFHLLTTWQSAVPLAQQFAHDSGLHFLGSPQWTGAGSASRVSMIAVQLGLLDAGFVLSLYAGWRVSRQLQPTASHALRMMTPWAAGALGLYAFGFWVLLQPMQMRGMAMQG